MDYRFLTFTKGLATVASRRKVKHFSGEGFYLIKRNRKTTSVLRNTCGSKHKILDTPACRHVLVVYFVGRYTLIFPLLMVAILNGCSPTFLPDDAVFWSAMI